MDEISLILKDNISITIEEFRILNTYSHIGKIWTVMWKQPYIIRQRANEYIMDSESLLLFKLISQNILITWDTEITRSLNSFDEFYIGNSIFIQPYFDSIRTI